MYDNLVKAWNVSPGLSLALLAPGTLGGLLACPSVRFLIPFCRTFIAATTPTPPIKPIVLSRRRCSVVLCCLQHASFGATSLQLYTNGAVRASACPLR